MFVNEVQLAFLYFFARTAIIVTSASALTESLMPVMFTRENIAFFDNS